jgi:ribonuclease VapC
VILDASAVIAVLRQEPEAEAFSQLIAATPVRRISVVNYVEAAVVINRSGDPVASRRVDEFVSAARLQIEAATEAQASLARQAYRDFGKGSGHPARLNLGDCFAYALAKAMDEALLFKGGDFAATDLRSALDERTGT